MASPRIVETLDIVKHVCPRLIARDVPCTVRALEFQRGEEALHCGIVPAVASAAHAAGNSLIGEQALEVLARVLAALVGMMQQRDRDARSPSSAHLSKVSGIAAEAQTVASDLVRGSAAMFGRLGNGHERLRCWLGRNAQGHVERTASPI